MNGEDLYIYRDINDLSSFVEIVTKSGYVFNSDTLIQDVVETNKNISNQLELSLASKALCIEKLWKIKDTPVAIERQFINLNLCESFDENDNLDDTAIERILSDNAIKVFNREEEVKIVQSNCEESSLLEIENDTDLLLIKGRSYNADSIPCQCYEIICLPQHVKYRSYTTYETE